MLSSGARPWGQALAVHQPHVLSPAGLLATQRKAEGIQHQTFTEQFTGTARTLGISV